MTQLDGTDQEILRLLVEDGRRPYSEIAERVGVSPPTVSDRVDRLLEDGVIRRFTLDLDRSALVDGIEVLVELDVDPAAGGAVAADLAEQPPVEHAYATADGTVIAAAAIPESDVDALLEGVDTGAVRNVDVRLLADRVRNPEAPVVAADAECEECGEPVADGGAIARIEGEVYRFCSSSCRESFRGASERLAGEP